MEAWDHFKDVNCENCDVENCEAINKIICIIRKINEIEKEKERKEWKPQL